MIAGWVFVTPHAVEQFRARIAPLIYEDARAAILASLAASTSALRPAHSGRGVFIRTRRPFAFRALIGPGDGALPAVITILRSGR